jgi:hypothetical protein
VQFCTALACTNPSNRAFAESSHVLKLSQHKVWQSLPLSATACQRKPKLREVRIAPVIFRFIESTSFGNAPFGQISCYCQAEKSSSHDPVIRVYDDASNVIETHEHTDDFKRAVSQQAAFRLAVFDPALVEELTLSFCREPHLDRSRNRRSGVSSNHS